MPRTRASRTAIPNRGIRQSPKRLYVHCAVMCVVSGRLWNDDNAEPVIIARISMSCRTAVVRCPKAWPHIAYIQAGELMKKASIYGVNNQSMASIALTSGP